jgi:hypothetical protein
MYAQPTNSLIFSERYTITDPAHFHAAFFSADTLQRIQRAATDRLQALGVPYTPSEDAVRGVMDSVFHSSPRVGLPEQARMCVDYIVSYLKNEHDVLTQNSRYDISVLKYDGSYGIQQMSQGQVPLKVKGPNRFQFRMIY